MKKIFLITFILIAFIIIAALFIELPVPPTSLHKSARQALHQAKLVRADQLAPNSFKEEQILFDSAMSYWAIENEKFMLLRNYSFMQFYLERSQLAAELAYKVAKNERKNYQENLLQQIENIADMFSYYALYLANVPLSKQDSKAMNLAKLQLEVIILSVEKDLLTGVDKKLTQVHNIVNSLIITSKELIRHYFEDYPNWEELREKAIKESQQKHTHLIIIDKFKRSCQVFKNGKIITTFSVELGSNWIGDKQRAGDKSTPEGAYKILVKKAASQTKFHKAFLLNYPNEVDLKRYQMNIKNGVIPKNARTGGDIEIHGMGGKGTDWTDGCIALSNQDMDQLYDMVSVNTPILIVGSTQPLKTVLPQ